jgi:hypothetical protein
MTRDPRLFLGSDGEVELGTPIDGAACLVLGSA